MPTATASDSGPTSALHYPRTGKRGVPQQFPRRLYEMLQSETKLIEASIDHPKIIFWSKSGKAFRIADVAEFSVTILPKYFRTKKFSSFQRNLNLYGFAKVRRGPETDMYTHPAFARDQPETLSHLRKLASTSTSKRRARVATSTSTASQKVPTSVTRSVSPSMSPPHLVRPTAFSNYQAVPLPMLPRKPSASPYSSPRQSTVLASMHQVPLSPEISGNVTVVASGQRSQGIPKRHSRGRLDLLAMAMEQATALST